MSTDAIAVLGFGRSGTTWVSDIISKATGSLLLFEPLHPSVTETSRKYSYSKISTSEDSEFLERYFVDTLNKRHRKKWLMRNHAPFPLDDVSDGFLDTLWRECDVSGFKCIRANFMIDWLRESLDARIVFLVRHPCEVVASIKRRKNFWEFGWPQTYELFLEKTVYSEQFKGHEVTSRMEAVERADSDVARFAVMWSITHAISLPMLSKLGLPVFFYEHFYREPFRTSRALLDYIGFKELGLHPAHIFTPSMTTLKTVHGLRSKEDDILRKGAAVFWENTLSDKEVSEIMEIARSFDINIYDEGGVPLYPASPAYI